MISVGSFSGADKRHNIERNEDMRKAKRSIIYALTVLLSVSVLLVVHRLPILSVNYVYYKFHPEESIFCYAAKESSLVDISEVEPKKGRSIFFHETSCSSLLDGKITINPRQACAVESAAKLHPDHEVYLLFTSPGTFAKGDDNHIIDALRKYENVKLLHVNFTRYVEGTKVQLLYENGQLPYSNYARSHASDVLRYLTLHKYGGIYLDLDVVVIKPLNGLGENFAGAESRRNVAAGVLGFASSGPGHQLVDMCLDDLSKNFDGWNWGNNGPGVITRYNLAIFIANPIWPFFTFTIPAKTYRVPKYRDVVLSYFVKH